MFASNGWMIEHAKPAKMTFVAEAKCVEAMNSFDGMASRRDPRLQPEPVNPDRCAAAVCRNQRVEQSLAR